MKFIKVAVVAAIVVSGSAFAGSIPQYGHGGHNSGPNSELGIFQYGSTNAALALQTDARDSSLTITQNGTGNGADVGQGSDDSTIELTQTGSRNNATIDQWNSRDSEINVNQHGVLNGALVNQTASNSFVEVRQVGFGNNATANQY
ncbi:MULTISPECIES: curli major subunit CsgA [unclassified Enterobacter]|jgi:major curlin subunit|uniref:curli major subunit CsgA n=1 Tax=unclassified Enterobacter TaxID=2608935 RepID=UPI000934A478|nr:MULTISPECIES: curli major subunit CsgA [unclassified Enterobacter]WJD48166.1 curli major subunit CsgA [Enterobacter sp. PGRG2]